MTEDEWLTASDPLDMVSYLLRRTTQRKLRLFACGCCRYAWAKPKSRLARTAVEMAEQYADGLIALDQLASCYQRLRASLRRKRPFQDQIITAAETACAVEGADGIRAGVQRVAVDLSNAAPCCDLLRCVLGNPFRPITLSPSWLTSTALSLAQGMYDTRDFSAMPILADALQDANCDDEAILAHCRGPGPHARG